MHLKPVSGFTPAALAFVLFAAVISGFTLRPEHPDTGMRTAAFEEQILQYVNEYRQTKSLPALQMIPVISAQATLHSTDMATGKSAFGHDGFDARVSAITRQLSSSRKFAENVAYGHLGAREVVELWLNSPGHKHNIEGAYALTGIGTASRDDGAIFFTQIFAAR